MFGIGSTWGSRGQWTFLPVIWQWQLVAVERRSWVVAGLGKSHLHGGTSHALPQPGLPSSLPSFQHSRAGQLPGPGFPLRPTQELQFQEALGGRGAELQHWSQPAEKDLCPPLCWVTRGEEPPHLVRGLIYNASIIVLNLVRLIRELKPFI